MRFALGYQSEAEDLPDDSNYDVSPRLPAERSSAPITPPSVGEVLSADLSKTTELKEMEFKYALDPSVPQKRDGRWARDSMKSLFPDVTKRGIADLVRIR